MPPHSDPSTTLTTQKTTFLTRQIRLLSTPLTPPSLSSLPDSVTTPLFAKLNKKITSHNRLSFPLQSQRHVLEQVEGVYWRDVLRDGLPVGKTETLVRKDVDFTNVDGVHGLGEWEDVVCGEEDEREEEGGRRSKRRRIERDSDTREDEHHHEDTNSISEHRSRSHRYTNLKAHLSHSQIRRDTLRDRLSALRRLKEKLTPFEDPQINIQPNLMWKGNKEVEAEIARMRVLLVRCREVGIRGSIEAAEDEERVVQTDMQRIESVLGLG